MRTVMPLPIEKVSAVRPGQYFVILDTSVPGGKWVDDVLYHGTRDADKEAEKLRKFRNEKMWERYPYDAGIQVVDAVWFGPSEAKLKALGMRAARTKQDSHATGPSVKETHAMGFKSTKNADDQVLPIERAASTSKKSWAKGEEGRKQWEVWFKEQPQEFQDKWNEMNELYGDVVKDQYKKSAEKLPDELEENKWTDSDGDNPPPNPKGSDADGDGKANEPKPFKSAARSSEFMPGERVNHWMHGKGTVTDVWNEYGKTGVSIEWDNGDFSNPMDGSRIMSDLSKLDNKLELVEGDVVQLHNGDQGTVERVRDIDAWVSFSYGASWVPLKSISKVLTKHRRRSAATSYALFDEEGNAYVGYVGMRSALIAAKRLAVRTNGEIVIQVRGTMDVVGYVQPDGSFDKMAASSTTASGEQMLRRAFVPDSVGGHLEWEDGTRTAVNKHSMRQDERPKEIHEVKDMEKLVGPIRFDSEGDENLHFTDGEGNQFFFKHDGRENDAKKIRRYFQASARVTLPVESKGRRA